jgi:hypothetical protein
MSRQMTFKNFLVGGLCLVMTCGAMSFIVGQWAGGRAGYATIPKLEAPDADVDQIYSYTNAQLEICDNGDIADNDVRFFDAPGTAINQVITIDGRNAGDTADVVTTISSGDGTSDDTILNNATGGFEFEIVNDANQIIFGQSGAVDTDGAYILMQNLDGEDCYIYPNATQDDIVVSATKPGSS